MNFVSGQVVVCVSAEEESGSLTEGGTYQIIRVAVSCDWDLITICNDRGFFDRFAAWRFEDAAEHLAKLREQNEREEAIVAAIVAAPSESLFEKLFGWLR
jgi:hypothetical protein